MSELNWERIHMEIGIIALISLIVSLMQLVLGYGSIARQEKIIPPIDALYELICDVSNRHVST